MGPINFYYEGLSLVQISSQCRFLISRFYGNFEAHHGLKNNRCLEEFLLQPNHSKEGKEVSKHVKIKKTLEAVQLVHDIEGVCAKQRYARSR